MEVTFLTTGMAMKGVAAGKLVVLLVKEDKKKKKKRMEKVLVVLGLMAPVPTHAETCWTLWVAPFWFDCLVLQA